MPLLILSALLAAAGIAIAVLGAILSQGESFGAAFYAMGGVIGFAAAVLFVLGLRNESQEESLRRAALDPDVSPRRGAVDPVTWKVGVAFGLLLLLLGIPMLFHTPRESLGEYPWLFIAGVALLLFSTTRLISHRRKPLV